MVHNLHIVEIVTVFEIIWFYDRTLIVSNFNTKQKRKEYYKCDKYLQVVINFYTKYNKNINIHVLTLYINNVPCLHLLSI